MSGGRGEQGRGGNQDDGRQKKKRERNIMRVGEGREKGWNGLQVLYLLTCAYIHTYILHTTQPYVTD